MAENTDNCYGIDARLFRIGTEPIRLRALLILSERSAGPSELAGLLAMSVADATRHLEQMREDDLVDVVGEVLGARSIEPSYRATVKLLWSDEEWAELSLSERRALSAATLQMIGTDVCEGLESGTFEAREDTHLSRKVSRVDEQGWRELSRIQAQALEDSFAVEAQSAERLAASGERGITVMTAMICCELPRPPVAAS